MGKLTIFITEGSLVKGSLYLYCILSIRRRSTGILEKQGQKNNGCLFDSH